MKILCVVDREWAIGNKGKLLFNLPDDLKRFKKMTMFNVIVMGRKTFESLPNSSPLPGRTNIVMTRDPEYKKEGIIIINSIEKLKEKLKEYKDKKIFLIGGGDLINQLIDEASEAYITKVNKKAKTSDVSIPNLDLLDEWELVEASDTYKYEELMYRYNYYRRI